MFWIAVICSRTKKNWIKSNNITFLTFQNHTLNIKITLLIIMHSTEPINLHLAHIEQIHTMTLELTVVLAQVVKGYD